MRFLLGSTKDAKIKGLNKAKNHAGMSCERPRREATRVINQIVGWGGGAVAPGTVLMDPEV